MYNEIVDRPDWQRTYLCDGKLYDLPRTSEGGSRAQQAILDQLLTEKPAGNYCYRYSKIEPDNPTDRELSSALNTVRSLLACQETIGAIEKIAGATGLSASGIKASHFKPGDFLTTHTDGKREVAFVLGLSKNWNVDWGGNLLFTQEDGSIAGIFQDLTGWTYSAYRNCTASAW